MNIDIYPVYPLLSSAYISQALAKINQRGSFLLKCLIKGIYAAVHSLDVQAYGSASGPWKKTNFGEESFLHIVEKASG